MFFSTISPLIWVLIGIFLLIFLIVKVKLHSFVALLISALFIALTEGMPIEKIASTISAGVGGILSALALIVVIGAIIGKLMTESGASQQIADTIVSSMGGKMLPFALLIIGTLFGMAMFYEVAFLIIIPLVLSIAKEANIHYMKLVIPAIAGATMGHSIFPPQPGPMALVSAFNADMSQVYVLGFIVVIPTIIASGVLVQRFIPGLEQMSLGDVMKPANRLPKAKLPSFGISILVPLLPAIIIIISSLVKNLCSNTDTFYQIFSFFGSAEISMLITLLAAIYFFGYKQGLSGEEISNHLSDAIRAISNVIIVIAAGGVMKEVIIEANVGQEIVRLIGNLSISPLILGWLITVLIRLMTGQGAVSAITAAGIVAPMVEAFDVNPVLMMLACATGSNTTTLMWDAGFLLYQQSFGISIKDTIKTWGVLEAVNSVVGLIIVLLLSLIL